MKTLITFFYAMFCSLQMFAQSNEKIQEEVWQREIEYWKYVAANDTVGYRTLWHERYIGYPGSELNDKSKISGWIPELHKKKDIRYEYKLEKKAVNVFDDVVIVFYDEQDIFKNKYDKTVETEIFKITHTWKKFGKEWLIIGGMSTSINKK